MENISEPREVISSHREDREETKEPDYNIRDTARKQEENEKYKRICSEIIEDFLYLGSDFVARDEKKLDEHKITHIVNCAADYSSNYFPDKYEYKAYHLKDSIREVRSLTSEH
jgi:hypothetical protein